jgi:hypothetical protein
MTAKYGWSEDVWGKIDLHNFGIHFKRLSMGQKVQHTMKYIYELQAVGSRKGHISNTDDGPMTRCPCCSIARETHEHLILCKDNPKREESIKAFKKEVCRSHGGNKFGSIIADAFDQWFHDPDTAPSIENTRDPALQYEDSLTVEYMAHVRTALRHQHEIGWMNATRGFLAKSWHHVACSQLQLPATNGEVTHTNRNDGHQRTYQAVRALYTLVSTIWKGRNEALYQRDQETDDIQRTAIDAEIAQIHCNPGTLPAEDQHCCNHSLADILKKSPAYKQRWLHRVRQAIDRKTSEQKRQQPLTIFFHRVPPQQQRLHSSDTITTKVRISRQHTSRRKAPRKMQTLLTEYLKERASNHPAPSNLTPPRPSPN